MKQFKKQPITGATRIENSKRAPLVTNAKDTSLAAQNNIKAAPTPFKDDMDTPQMPVGIGPGGAVPGTGAKLTSGLQHSSPGLKTGSFSPPKRKAGNPMNQPKSRKGAAFYGE